MRSRNGFDLKSLLLDPKFPFNFPFPLRGLSAASLPREGKTLPADKVVRCAFDGLLLPVACHPRASTEPKLLS